MAERRCPVCSQPLPTALTQIQINSKLQELAIPALAEERKRLQEEFKNQLATARETAKQHAERALRVEIQQARKRAEIAEKQRASQAAEFERKVRSEREKGRREAQSELSARIKAASKRADVAEAEAAKKIERSEKQTEQRLRKEMAHAVRMTTRENELKLDKLQTEREKERLRHEAESARLQGQLDNLSRKLEKQSGERLGEEGELDLFAELSRAFPKDRIERIGRGKRGADIVQHVMDGANNVGRIVYENKNVKVTGWSSAFIKQAGKYRAQYETPYVMIVSRAFPKKEKDFCIEREIPVVRPRMAVALASVMRDGIVVIGRLRLTGTGRDQKAHDLLQYLVSDKFATRFKGIADSVEGLREHQRKERNWHENLWETQADLHDRIDKSHREIGAQLGTILTTRRPVAMAVRA
ncbi:MAG: DUF2130 domain-containing protein [Acidobacteriia bacterium]|nr:DUF2130 domain-containing protein [Terriglobia bacterium]